MSFEEAFIAMIYRAIHFFLPWLHIGKRTWHSREFSEEHHILYWTCDICGRSPMKCWKWVRNDGVE